MTLSDVSTPRNDLAEGFRISGSPRPRCPSVEFGNPQTKNQLQMVSLTMSYTEPKARKRNRHTASFMRHVRRLRLVAENAHEVA
jgi:hypothetical protein